MSDPVSFACWLMGAGGIIGFVASPRETPQWSSLALTVASFAFAGITRSGEGAIVLVEMVACGLLVVHPSVSGTGPLAAATRRVRLLLRGGCKPGRHSRAIGSALHQSRLLGASPVESREWWRLYETLLSLPVPRIDRHISRQQSDVGYGRVLQRGPPPHDCVPLRIWRLDIHPEGPDTNDAG